MIAGMLAILGLWETIANSVLQSGKQKRINEAGVQFKEKRWSDGVKARGRQRIYVQSGSHQSILLAIQWKSLSSRAHYRWCLPGSRYAFNLPKYDVLGLPFYNNVVSTAILFTF